MTPIPFEVEKMVKRNTVILKLSGMLNTETRADLEPYVDDLNSSHNLQEVILNLDRLTHIDSRGLSTLLSMHRRFTERDIGFRLVNVNDYVLRLFQVSNLVNLFEIGPPPQDHASLVHDRREALWQSHAFTTQLLAALGEAVLGVDSDGKILFVNPAAERLLGWEEADLLGRSLVEALDPRDHSGRPVLMALTSHPALDLDQGPVVRVEVSLTKRSGEIAEVEWVATTIFQAGHRIGRVVGIRDLSQRRREQDEVKRLATAVDQAAEMIVVTDPEGVVQYVNPAFEKVTGYTREEAVGRRTNILKSGAHDPAFFEDLWKTIRKGQVWTGRFMNRRKDGRLYEEEATISPVHDASGAVINFVAVKRDITQEVLLEQQLRESQKFEAIAQLAGGIAHDFNNLLTSVIGNIQLAKIKKSGDVTAYLEKAEQACLRGASLVQQLLLYSRKTSSAKERISLNAIAREVLALARETIDRRIEFKVDLKQHLPLVRADSGQMHQVLLNLVVNARDAVEERCASESAQESSSGLSTDMRITVSTDVVTPEVHKVPTDALPPAEKYVVLTVADTGSGMDSKTRQHLFEPFFTTKEVGKGTGLGLATAYGIVKNHGGWVEVQSSPGIGSTFHVYLPADLTTPASQTSQPSLEPVPGGNETILVVDDETSICDVAKDILEAHGYSVLIALDGEEGLDVYSREMTGIDLVILDLSMPKLSGKEVLERLRILNPAVRVIISSGYLSGDIHSTASGCVFVQKPYRTEDLLRGVREALDDSSLITLHSG
jgi:anti-anti-sigma factor